jgi:hypothetical protein
MIKIELEFDGYEASILSHTSMKSFYAEQQERFEVVIDSTADLGYRSMIAAEQAGRGVFMWFNTFLEAKVYQSYYMQTGNVDSVMLYDMAYEDEGYVVWVDEHEHFITYNGAAND